MTGYVYVFPATLIIFLFGLFPILYAAYMSLYRWRVRQGRFHCASEINLPEGIAVFSFDGLSTISQQGELGLLLQGCLENYTEVVGNWWGALFFTLGFGILVGAYWLWNNAFKRIADRRLIYQLIMAVFVVGVGLFSIAYGWGLMMMDGDEDFLQGLIYTFYYAFGSVPFQLGLGLVLAYILYQNIRGRELYRMIFFLPYITPAVAAAVVFRIVFSPRETSLANTVVGWFGMDPQRWIAEPSPIINALFGLNLEGFWAGPSMALVSVIILGIWTYTGYNAVIFLAGLGSIPNDLYEAARVDGANQWHQFRTLRCRCYRPLPFIYRSWHSSGHLRPSTASTSCAIHSARAQRIPPVLSCSTLSSKRTNSGMRQRRQLCCFSLF
jgi:ABC-type sugar transport system permease subunit